MKDKTLKVTAISDLHLNLPRKFAGAPERFEEALKAAEDSDVFLLNGDIVDSRAEDAEYWLDYVIDRLSTLHTVNLYVMGNAELGFVDSISNYAEEFQAILGKSAHLLDADPVSVNQTDFVGTLGWCDGSLFQWDGNPSEYPTTVEEAEEVHNRAYAERYGSAWDTTNRGLFDQVQSRLYDHIKIINDQTNRGKVCFASHYVVSGKFCLYGKCQKYDYRNFSMGYDGREVLLSLKPDKTIVGHTHRAESHDVAGYLVENYSDRGIYTFDI